MLHNLACKWTTYILRVCCPGGSQDGGGDAAALRPGARQSGPKKARRIVPTLMGQSSESATESRSIQPAAEEGQQELPAVVEKGEKTEEGPKEEVADEAQAKQVATGVSLAMIAAAAGKKAACKQD